MAVPVGTVFSLEAGIFASSDISESHQITDANQSTAALVEEALEALELTEESEPMSSTSSGHSAGTTCLTCGISSFSSPEDQRQHFKTDWHRFNVKRKLAGLDPVTEDQFLALIENDEDRDAVGSLSGSESESESESEDENQGISTAASGPQFMFSAADGKHYSVWRCLVAPDRERGVDPPSPQDCLASLNELSSTGGRWAIVLLRGGHFSAAVYDIKPPKSSKTSSTAAGGPMQKFSAAAVDAALTEVLHKSFHKYVVRAKAGGKQSTKDATGKYARSAGSRLRRHNEAALQRDIAETLSSWKESLDTCSLILVSAPGSNGKTLFAGDSPMLNKGDSRVRRIPFVTRRPTQSETKRVARVLLTVYDASAVAAAAAAEAKAAEESSAEEKKKGKLEEGKKMAETAATAAEDQAAKEREEALKAKKAEKRARQKQKEKEKRQAEAAEKAEAAAEAAKLSAEDEISRAARQAAAVAQRAAAQAAQKSAANKQASAQASAPPPRLSSKPLASEDAASRRARMASAAEARLKALQAASSQQKLY